MVKQIIQDMNGTSDRRSIRNIPLPENKRSEGEPDVKTETMSPIKNSREKYPKIKKGKRFPFVKLGIFIVIVIFILGGLISWVTAKAEVAVEPRSQVVTLREATLIFDNTSGNNEYTIAEYSETKGVVVEATQELEVEEKAKGTVIVYNDYSTKSQNLVVNTRFQTPEGLIYRATKPITIPGQSIVNGETQPGSVEVEVVADEPGESYNTGLTDFTLPGLEGDQSFDFIYARSKTPISGGLSGVVKEVAPEKESAANRQIESELQKTLVSSLETVAPENYVFFEELSEISFTQAPQSNSTDTSVQINRTGTIVATVLSEEVLERQILDVAGIQSGDDVRIENLDELAVIVENIDLSDKSGVVTISLSGDAKVVWEIDEDQIASDLEGVSSGELTEIMERYESVVSAKATIRPAWRWTFPEASSISVVEKTE